jgi:hypothetical protein
MRPPRGMLDHEAKVERRALRMQDANVCNGGPDGKALVRTETEH